MAFKPRNAKDAKKREDNKGSRGMFKRRRSSAASPPRRLREMGPQGRQVLKELITENSKIVPGAHHRNQDRYPARACLSIKRARYLALMPYADLH